MRPRHRELRLNTVEADLKCLSITVAIARDNLGGAAGCGVGEGAVGLFAADQALARWLTQQLEDHLSYLRADLGRNRTPLAPRSARHTAPMPRPPEPGDSHSRARFVIRRSSHSIHSPARTAHHPAVAALSIMSTHPRTLPAALAAGTACRLAPEHESVAFTVVSSCR